MMLPLYVPMEQIMSMEDKVAIPHIWEVSRVVYEYFNGEGTSPIKIYEK